MQSSIEMTKKNIDIYQKELGCELILTHSLNIELKSNAAFIFVKHDDVISKLFYVNKRRQQQKEITVDYLMLKELETLLKPFAEPRLLTDIELDDIYKKTECLHYDCSDLNAYTVARLLEMQSENLNSILQIGAKHGHYRLVQDIIDRAFQEGQNELLKYNLEVRDESEFNILHLACYIPRNEKVITMLVTAAKELKIPNYINEKSSSSNNSMAALHIASLRSSSNMETLIELGANIDQETDANQKFFQLIPHNKYAFSKKNRSSVMLQSMLKRTKVKLLFQEEYSSSENINMDDKLLYDTYEMQTLINEKSSAKDFEAWLKAEQYYLNGIWELIQYKRLIEKINFFYIYNQVFDAKPPLTFEKINNDDLNNKTYKESFDKKIAELTSIKNKYEELFNTNYDDRKKKIIDYVIKYTILKNLNCHLTERAAFGFIISTKHTGFITELLVHLDSNMLFAKYTGVTLYFSETKPTLSLIEGLDFKTNTAFIRYSNLEEELYFYRKKPPLLIALPQPLFDIKKFDQIYQPLKKEKILDYETFSSMINFIHLDNKFYQAESLIDDDIRLHYAMILSIAHADIYLNSPSFSEIRCYTGSFKKVNNLQHRAFIHCSDGFYLVYKENIDDIAQHQIKIPLHDNIKKLLQNRFSLTKNSYNLTKDEFSEIYDECINAYYYQEKKKKDNLLVTLFNPRGKKNSQLQQLPKIDWLDKVKEIKIFKEKTNSKVGTLQEMEKAIQKLPDDWDAKNVIIQDLENKGIMIRKSGISPRLKNVFSKSGDMNK